MTSVTAAGDLIQSLIALFDMPNLNRFDILQNCLIDIDIFQNHHIDIDIDIDIFGITLSISISISIFFRIALSISISISIFSTSPYRYRYRYRYFSKVSIYRQSIFHIDILTRRRSNKNVFYRCTRGRSNKMCFTGAKKCLFYHFFLNTYASKE